MKASEWRELFDKAVAQSGDPDPEVKFSVGGKQVADKNIYATVREVTSIVASGGFPAPSKPAPAPAASSDPADAEPAQPAPAATNPLAINPLAYQRATIVTQPKMIMVEMF